MSRGTFKLVDLRFLVTALVEMKSHSGITAFELGLGLNTDDGRNKTDRATAILRHIFDQPNADELIVQLLNYMFVENPNAHYPGAATIVATLKEKVLDPRGVELTDDGYRLPVGADYEPKVKHAGTGGRMAQAPAGPSPQKGQTSARTGLQRDPRKIFVVHGRDLRPVAVLGQFLQFIGLEMMAWSDAVKCTGKPQPHTYEIVKAGMEAAAAVVVLFSPDDLVQPKTEFRDASEPRQAQGQARPNVLLEAGMAFAMAPDRTVFVKSAATREISDIAGFNWVKLDGTWDSRKDLRDRMESAGADVRTGDYNFLDSLAGAFRVQ